MPAQSYGTHLKRIRALDLELPFAFGFLCLPHIVRNIEHKIKSDLHLSDSFYRTVAKDFLLINSKRDWTGLVLIVYVAPDRQHAFFPAP